MIDKFRQPFGNYRFGNYRLVRLVGKGGAAEVYLGEHIHLGTQAAIKVLHTSLAGDEVERFRAEARTLARLAHPHIVRVLDFDVQDGVPFLVMDYAPNGSLRRYFPKGQIVFLTQIVCYVKQVAAALQFAHNEKIIHRDVKPENMLVGTHQDILLSDFGIAMIAQSSRYQEMMDIAGTISYMAPEQIKGKPRAASDQYALGVVVYEWLCGSRPFEGSINEVMVQHLSMPPQPLHERVPTIAAEVEQVVLRALAKDPKERYASVLDFATALERASQLAVASGHPGDSKQTIPSGDVPKGAVEPTVFPGSSAPADPTKPPSKRGISRRKAIITVGSFLAAGGLAAGGVVTLHTQWPQRLLSSLHPTIQSTSGHTASSPQKAFQVYTYRGHKDVVEVVAWSPDGTRIASGSWDKTVQVWDAKNGDKLTFYQGQDEVFAVAWSPDSTLIASGSWDKTVQVWDATNGQLLRIYRQHTDRLYAVAWSPDGTRIASGGKDNTVHVWNVRSGQRLVTYRGHTDLIRRVAWSPDSKYIASGSHDTTVHVWNAANGNLFYIYPGHSDWVVGVAWAPDGKRIASSSRDKTVQVWDAFTGAHATIYQRHSKEVESVAWRIGSEPPCIASGSEDLTVQVWRVTDRMLLHKLPGSNEVESVTWSPDGTHLAFGLADMTVQVWYIP